MSPLPAEDSQLSAALAAAAGLTPALPEPLEEEQPNHLQLQDAVREDQIPVAAVVEGQDQGHDQGQGEGGDVREDHIPVGAAVEGQGQGGEGEAGLPFEPKLEPGAAEAATIAIPTPKPKDPPKPKKPRVKKLPLPPHEALLFASRGIYVDGETGRLRCSCNHKPCDKWDQFGYTRHFRFKCHRRYEEERLDDDEIRRLREAKETYLRCHPVVEEPSIRRKRKMREGEKMLNADELRVQERHWMSMWKDAKNELRQMRQELKDEVDEEVRAELMADIEGLKRRKGDWARLLGLNPLAQGFAVNL